MRRALIGRNPKATLCRILVALALAGIIAVVLNFILLPIRVDGISMLPTYKDRSVNFINRLAYLRHEPQRGDVVGIRLTGKHMMYLKRIVALPGETVAFADGRVLIDGKMLDEPYEKFFCDWNLPPVKLGPAQYYVVGDNRSMPEQNHTKGVCERDRILGRILE